MPFFQTKNAIGVNANPSKNSPHAKVLHSTDVVDTSRLNNNNVIQPCSCDANASVTREASDFNNSGETTPWNYDLPGWDLVRLKANIFITLLFIIAFYHVVM